MGQKTEGVALTLNKCALQQSTSIKIFITSDPFLSDFVKLLRDAPVKKTAWLRSVATEHGRAYVAEDLGLGTLRGDQRLQLPRLLRLRPPPRHLVFFRFQCLFWFCLVLFRSTACAELGASHLCTSQLKHRRNIDETWQNHIP